jgi:hypothetical protein
MNRKHSINILAIALLFIAQSPLFGAESKPTWTAETEKVGSRGYISGKPNLVLKNNSIWDVEYKITNSYTPYNASGIHKLAPGSYVTMDGEPDVSIRRSGILSGAMSSWVVVPKILTLMKSFTMKNISETRSSNFIVNIGSTPFGWDFKLSYTNSF